MGLNHKIKMTRPSKLQKILELLMLLSGGIRYTQREIAERLDISGRSVFRYIGELRQVGFIIPPPKNGRYYIDKQSPYFREARLSTAPHWN